MSATSLPSGAPAGRALKTALWAAQVLVALPFTIFGLAKLAMPIPKLATIMAWTGQLPEPFVRFIGVVDILGGIGILLPALTRIQPRLTVTAAGGCVVLQILAIAFHLSRGEGALTPLNFVLLGLAAFVWWGRGRKAPIGAQR